MSRFLERLQKNWKEGRFFCIGLDSDATKLQSGESQFSFNRRIVDATADLVCAFKLNSAFYESEGVSGFDTLRMTVDYLREKWPQALVILDGKRGDIGNSSEAYARAAFDLLGVDAMTLSPYMGQTSLQPFLDYREKGCFILCRTSNEGAGEFQDLDVGGEPLFMRVARQVATRWNKNQNCGLVVGATAPEELARVRKVSPDLPILVPGIGAQGGTVKPQAGLVLNVSRAVIFADDPRAALRKISPVS